MSVSTHPGTETLLRYAAGTLPAGPRLLVDVHLDGCPECRAAVRRFTAVGGALLDASEPLALAPDALDRVLARLDGPPARRNPGLLHHAEAAGAMPQKRHPLPEGLKLPPGVVLPPAIASRRIGRMVPVSPGVRLGLVHLEEDPDAQVLLFRIAPGRSIPQHTHAGLEFTHVICGGFSDPNGHYGPGDLVECDADIDHSPRVDDDGECICLAAFDGRIRFRGLLGMVTRPFL